MHARRGGTRKSRNTLGRKSLGLLGSGALVLAGLAGAIWAPSAFAVEGFPVIDPGSGTAGAKDPNWDIDTNYSVGGTYTSDGWLRLLDDSQNRITNMLNKTSFSSDTGFIAEFDYRLTGGNNIGLGDGFSFYLTDGGASVSEGGDGDGLAYANSNTSSSANGVQHGVLGVGFDAFGGFGDAYSNTGCDRGGFGSGLRPNAVGVRGSGNTQCGTGQYPLLNNTVYQLDSLGLGTLATDPEGSPDPATSSSSNYRHVRMVIAPASGSAAPTLSVAISDAVQKDQAYTALKPVVTNMALDPSQVVMPSTLKLGFGGSTGSATAYVDLRNISISALADLSISSSFTTSQPTDGYLPGSQVGLEMQTFDLGPTSLQPGSGQGADANARMVADLSALQLASAPTMTPSASTSTGAVTDPMWQDGKAIASWWSDASAQSSTGMTVKFTLPSDIAAGTYTIPTYVPTDFTNYTLDQASSYVTPDKTASDPNLTNNSSNLELTVAQVPAIKWGTPTATLADGDQFKSGSTVNFVFPYTNTGNTPIDVTATVGDFTGDPTPSLVCDPASAVIGGTGQCTATYTLTQADVDNGGVSMEATATGTSSENKTASTGSTTALLQQTPATGLTLTKSAQAPDVMAQGEEVSYSFTATNTGQATLTGLSIDDSAGFGGKGSAPTVTCDETELAPGASTTCAATYALVQEDVDAEGFTNNATASATALANAQIPGASPIQVSSSSASASFSGDPKSQLVLTKTGRLADNATFAAGQKLDFTFTLSNTGASTLTIPTDAVTEQSVSGGGTLPDVDCTQAQTSLEPGQTTQCTASYTLTQENVDQEEVVNTASATATFKPEGKPDVTVDAGSVTATVPLSPVAALSLTTSSTAPQTWAAEQDAELKFTVVNSGQLTLTDPVVTLNSIGAQGTPPQVTCAAVPVGRLQPGQALQCSAQYSLSQDDVNAGKVDYSAKASATTPQSTSVDSAEAEGSFSGVGVASMVITKTATPPAQFDTGQSVGYTFKIENTGAVTLSDVSISDPGPSAANPSGWTEPTRCAATLAPGESTECTGSYELAQADVNEGVVSNTALATAKDPSGLEIKSASSTVSSGPNVDGTTDDHRGKISVSLAAGTVPDPVAIGSAVPFTLTITNSGPVTLQDPQAALNGLQVGSGPGQYQLSCPSGELQPSGSVECSVSYYLSSNDVSTGTASIAATASAVSTLGVATDQVTSNTATVTFEVPGAITAKGSVALASGETYKAGSHVVYTVRVSDTGQTPVSDVSVVSSAFTGTGAAPTFTCVPDDVDPDNVSVCTATYQLTQADVDNAYSQAPGPLSITADVTAKTGNPATEQSTVVHAGPLQELLAGQPAKSLTVAGVSPSVSPDQFKDGAQITFPFTVTNSGGVTLSDVAAKAALSAGTGDVGPVTCNPDLGDLAPNASADCEVTYTLSQADVDSGTAGLAISASGKYGQSASDTVVGALSPSVSVVPVGAIELTKSVVGPGSEDFKAGAVLDYTFTIQNTGNATLSNVELSEGAFTGSGPKPQPDCQDGSLDSLAPGETVACTAQYTLTQADVDGLQVNNQASVTSQYYGGKMSAADSSVAPFSSVASDGISIVQTVSSLTHPAPGDVLHYTFTIKNTGQLSLVGWQVESSEFTGHGQMSDIDCPDAGEPLLPGESTTCTATYTVQEQDLQAGSIDSTATVQAGSSEGTVGDSSKVVSTLDASHGVSIVKTVTLEAGELFEAGSTVQFKFTVANTGTLDIDSFTIAEDASFAGADEVDMSDCANPGQLAWNADPYTCVGTYVLTQDDINAGGLVNTANVKGSVTQDGKPVQVENSSTISIRGTGTTSVSLEKTVTDLAAKDFVPGAEVGYQFKVTNSGTVTLSDVALSETEFSGTGQLGDVTCDTSGDLQPGQSQLCHATYQLTQADVDAERLENTATVTAKPANGAPEVTDSDTATLAPEGIVSSIQVADKALTTNGAQLKEGSTVKFKISVVNDGVTTLHGVTVTGYAMSGKAQGQSQASSSGAEPQTGLATPPSGADVVQPVCPSIPDSFAPGASFECTVSFKVTAADLKAGAVTSVVTATGTNELGKSVSASATADVTGLKVPVAHEKLASTGAEMLPAVVALVALAAGFLLVLGSRKMRA